jgi:MFS family permease
MSDPASGAPWWRGLTARHWTVLAISWFGWVFDIMDVYLLAVMKGPAFTSLLGPGGADRVNTFGGWVLCLTLVGWALGGLVFGVVADRWGRTRTMALTILIYSIFTGLGGLAQNWQQLFLCRFVAALGIGGEWGTGASLIAEVFPPRARAVGAGLLQAASGAGFFLGGFVLWLIKIWGPAGWEPWRLAFIAGAFPALLALVVRLVLRESEAWESARARARAGLAERLGSLRALFGDPELRRRTLVATGLATVGICAFWGTNFWAPESLVDLLKQLGHTPKQIESIRPTGLMVLNAGVFLGFLLYIPLTQRIGRKRAFFWFHLGALLSVPAAFLFSTTYALWLGLFFVAGLFAAGIFSGYTITFPELFPTRLRATGASFCYNVGRVASSPGPVLAGGLSGLLGIATAGAIMGAVYALAFLFIPFLPETRDIELVEKDAAAT